MSCQWESSKHPHPSSQFFLTIQLVRSSTNPIKQPMATTMTTSSKVDKMGASVASGKKTSVGLEVMEQLC